MGALSNIDQDGFASAAFHSFPSTLKWDAYSGDYGPNFFGHCVHVLPPTWSTIRMFGWQAFGGNVQTKGDWVRVFPKDALRRRVYIAPRGLFLTLDAGALSAQKSTPKPMPSASRFRPRVWPRRAPFCDWSNRVKSQESEPIARKNKPRRSGTLLLSRCKRAP